jgi:hypothetical protein
MKLTAYLLAFTEETPIPTREIDIPDHEVIEMATLPLRTEQKIDYLLGMAFQYGQNDFQPKPARSVSVGDVIRLESGSLHRVLGAGWEHLPASTDINRLERGLRAVLR